MTKKWTVSLTITGMLLLMLTCAMPAWAGHYIDGAEGAMAASVPPPGFHYKQYNFYLESDTLTDPDGDDLDIGLDVNILAQLNRVIYITKQKFLGADYGMSVAVPLVAVDFEIGAMNYHYSEATLGDIFIEPLILAWHTDRWDSAVGMGFNLPTGDLDEQLPLFLGQGCFSGMLTLGATYYLDQAKTWTVSALSRTLVYGEQDHTDVTPGWEVIVDWGIGKQFPVSKGLLVRPALCGSTYWQIGEDDGPNTNDEKGERYSIGAEVNLFWLPPHLWQLNLRVLQDFAAEDEAEVTRVIFSVVKSF